MAFVCVSIRPCVQQPQRGSAVAGPHAQLALAPRRRARCGRRMPRLASFTADPSSGRRFAIRADFEEAESGREQEVAFLDVAFPASHTFATDDEEIAAGGGGGSAPPRAAVVALGPDDEEPEALEQAARAEAAAEVVDQAPSSLLKRIIAAYNQSLHAHPVLTKSVTSSVFCALADILSQLIERWKRNEAPGGLKLARILRMATVGMCLNGPSIHAWYTLFLDRVVPGNRKRDVFVKLLLDEMIFAPASIVAFFCVMTVLERRDAGYARDRIRQEFWNTWRTDMSIWPAAQAINFKWIPRIYCALYMNFVSVVWAVFLAGQAQKEIVRTKAPVLTANSSS